MSRYRLVEGLFVRPTPAGAYHAVASPVEDPVRAVLRSLLAQDATPELTIESVRSWTAASTDDEAVERLLVAQDHGYLEGYDHAVHAPSGALEDLVPELLEPLSGSDRSLLADGQGFCIAARGFDHATAAELSAMSADLASLHQRHLGALAHDHHLSRGAWALVDASGNSQVGFWPLYIGAEQFVLVVGGQPFMHRPQLTELIWTLTIRYGAQRVELTEASMF